MLSDVLGLGALEQQFTFEIIYIYLLFNIAETKYTAFFFASFIFNVCSFGRRLSTMVDVSVFRCGWL